MTLDLAVDLLRRCLSESDPVVRLDLIREFEDVTLHPDDVRDERLLDVLATARHDLSFYEPRKDWRVDRSLYDDTMLNRELKEILHDLGQSEADLSAIDVALMDPEPTLWRRLLQRIGRGGDGPTSDIGRR